MIDRGATARLDAARHIVIAWMWPEQGG